MHRRCLLAQLPPSLHCQSTRYEGSHAT
jgi:hypothetical protein